MSGNSVPLRGRPTGVVRLVGALLMAAVVVACGDSNPIGGGFVESIADDSIPVVDLSKAPVADAPDPADRSGAAAGFLECRFGISQGGWSMDFGWSGGEPDSDGALLDFVDGGLFALPAGRYEPAGRDEGRRLYTYSVGGEAKVAVIVADGAAVPLEGDDHGWGVETFATCDPAEYDPAVDDQLPMDIWLDADGHRVPTSIVSSSQGAEHCDWQSATILWHQDRQYIGDPEGVLSDFGFVAPYEPETDIPSDATDTGYHRDGRHLWLSADGNVAYIVEGDLVQAWPTPTELIGCA
jgi:hypothetical protein